MITVTGIFIYPIKGCRGISLSSCSVDSLGFEGDRRFMLVHPDGSPLTQRTHPRMAQIETALTRSDLVATVPGQSPLSIPRAANPSEIREVQVWSSSGLRADGCGPQADEWFSQFLGDPVHLVCIGSAFNRPVKPSKAKPGDVVSFADAYPFLLISEASLADLNGRLVSELNAPVPMNRFRPNVVVTGCEAFAEDTWTKFQIGSTVFRTSGNCARCLVPNTDQITGTRGKEPLATLATYRRPDDNPNEVIFGQNLIHETKSGVLHLGDRLELLP